MITYRAHLKMVRGSSEKPREGPGGKTGSPWGVKVARESPSPTFRPPVLLAFFLALPWAPCKAFLNVFPIPFKYCSKAFQRPSKGLIKASKDLQKACTMLFKSPLGDPQSPWETLGAPRSPLRAPGSPWEPLEPLLVT